MRLAVTMALWLSAGGLLGLAATADQSPTASAQEKTDSGYVLGPGDQITIRVSGIDEINDKPVPVENSGYVRLPLAGRIKASGLTVEQFESELIDKLKTYVLNPDVSVSLTTPHSQPVSVIGAVKNPGVYQVEGRKTLVEMLSMAGGLDPLAAGSTITVTRPLGSGRLPILNAEDSADGKYSIAHVNLNDILRAGNPHNNVEVMPHDVISVPHAEMVYVVGQVTKSGAFPLNQASDVTVLKALSMAGGLDKAAKPQKAAILRSVPGKTEKTQIAVDLRKILDSRAEDVRMQPEDILFVPSSAPKKAAYRAAEAAIQMGTGVVIWGR